MNKRRNVTRTVVLYAVYFALIFVARLLDKAVTGFLPINAAIITLTVAFSCALVEPSFVNAVVVGAIFGVVSLIATAIMGGTPDFLNPLVSVLPRIVVGMALFGAFYGVSRIMRKITKKYAFAMVVAIVVACVIGALVNTVTVLGMINLFKMNGEWFASVISTIIAINGTLELTVPPVITPIIVMGVRRGMRIKDEYNCVTETEGGSAL
jgi:uncharacterized membrane protein